jgi:hypothetical protein
MSNPSKARGTRWESAVVAFLSEHFPYIERRTQAGANDRGDVAGLPGVVIECKSAKRYELGQWLKEAHTEKTNAAARLGLVWMHRKGKASAGDGYVVIDGHTLVYLLKEAGW